MKLLAAAAFAIPLLAAETPRHILNTRENALPAELQGIGIDQKLNAQIPLQTEFVDQDGQKVTLGSYFGILFRSSLVGISTSWRSVSIRVIPRR